MRNARGTSPPNAASPNWNTSKRALSAIEACAVARSMRVPPVSFSFSSSWCAARRFPSVRSTMKRTASSSISMDICAARARSHCGSRATSTGHTGSQAPVASNDFTQAELFCSRSSLPVIMR